MDRRLNESFRDPEEGTMPEPIVTVTTRSGVETPDQPCGTIEILFSPGDTSVELFTDDGRGNATRVWLGWHDIAHMVMALASCGHKL
jgi:hypothetical protein